MAEMYKISSERLTSIANAIRSKIGSAESMTPEQMPNKISAIQPGSGVSFANTVTCVLPYIHKVAATSEITLDYAAYESSALVDLKGD